MGEAMAKTHAFTTWRLVRQVVLRILVVLAAYAGVFYGTHGREAYLAKRDAHDDRQKAGPYAPEPGEPELALWGTEDYEFRIGISESDEIMSAFGEPDESLDGPNKHLWRSTYRYPYEVRRRWHNHGHDELITRGHFLFEQALIASFDENGILQNWRHHSPVLVAKYCPYVPPAGDRPARWSGRKTSPFLEGQRMRVRQVSGGVYE